MESDYRRFAFFFFLEHIAGSLQHPEKEGSGQTAMADYHFVYKDVEGASTQWDDIQRKLGNLPPKPPAFKPPAFTPAPDSDSPPKDKSWIDDKTEEELEELEDDPDLDDDRFLEEYRSVPSIYLFLDFTIKMFACFCLIC